MRRVYGAVSSIGGNPTSGVVYGTPTIRPTRRAVAATSSTVQPKHVVFAFPVLVVLLSIVLGRGASAQIAPVLEVEGFGTMGGEVVEVQVNGVTYDNLTLTNVASTVSTTLPDNTTWGDISLFFTDGPGMDVSFLSFSLAGDQRTMTAGDVLVSGQWDSNAGACSTLGPPTGNTIHCQGFVQFPEDDGPANPPPSTLDPSYWGNAQTIVPVYDTVWDLGVSARTEQVVEYSQFLSNAGFSGFATTYLGSVHRPARRPDQGNVFVRPDPYGNPIATWDDQAGNLVLGQAHADRFEEYLDAAHAEGLRVVLYVIWERKAIDEYGLINENNAYHWAFQLGSRFKDHPAIQSWAMGGDAETDNARTQLWNNAVDGLRDAGVTGDISYGTGSSPQRRINNLSAPWNSSQFVQTSHCGTPALVQSRIAGVVAAADIPVWAGEMRYEDIHATWCNPPVEIPGGPEVTADAIAAIDGGAQGIVYGHNDRWQWGHGALGGGNQGWASVQASFTAPGQFMVINALTPDDIEPPDLTLTSPADGATIGASTLDIAGTVADTGSGVDSVWVEVERLNVSPAEYWDGTSWSTTGAAPVLVADLDGLGGWSIPGVDFTAGDYELRFEASDALGNMTIVRAATVTVVGTTASPTTELLATVAADPSDDPNATDPTPVWAVTEGNGRFYIGGNFQEVGAEPQPYLASIEAATGRLDQAFRPSISGLATEVTALALSPDGQDLYVGGRFTQIDGTFRNRIAKLDARSGAVDPLFNPDASAVVETIAVDSSGVYAGGAFATIGGGSSPHLAKLDATTGVLDPDWSATVDGNVLALELLDANNIFVGGNFTNANGSPHPFLVRLDSTTGSVAAGWSPVDPVPQKVLSLAARPDDSMIYVGVAGTAGELGNTVWAYSAGGARVWQRPSGGDIQALEATDEIVYVGTHGEWVFLEPKFELDGITPNPSFPTNGYVEGPQNPNAVQRKKFWAADAASGFVLDWDPNADSINGVWDLEIGPRGLLAGGDFMTITNPTGVAGQGDAAFSPHVAVFSNAGPPLDLAPEPNFDVDCVGTSCSFDASASQDDGTIVAFDWEFGGLQTATGVIANVTLANDTMHTVTLAVTDDAGQTVTRQERVILGSGGLPIEHVSSATSSTNGDVLANSIPAGAAAGDVAIALVSMNTSSTTATAPAGWTLVADEVDGQLRSQVFSRVLDSADAGTSPNFSLSAVSKANLAMSVFRNANPAQPIHVITSTAEIQNRVGHRAPALTPMVDSVILRHWAQRSTGTTKFTPRGREAMLTSGFGVDGASISTVSSIDPVIASTPVAASVAVAERHSVNAIGWTIALQPDGPRLCNGLVPTIDLNVTPGAPATNDADVILGTPGPDTISGLGGADTICGMGGDDTIAGGGGNDTIFGGDGEDTIFGGNNNDVIFGGADNDTIQGNDGVDTLNGDDGEDTLSGNDGADTLNGGADNDLLYGVAGNDTINGDGGADTILGGLDDDTINGGAGDDLISGNAGADTINGDSDNDTLYGSTEADTINGGTGLDTILGGTGDDIIDGGDDRDLLSGNEDNDTINGGAGNDDIFGVDGADTLNGDAGIDLILGGNGDDTINGGTEGDLLSGNADNDTIDGGAGDDEIYGVGGEDTLTGGPGEDTILGGPDNDTINSNGDSEIDQVSGNTGTDTCNTDNGPIIFDNVFQCELP